MIQFVVGAAAGYVFGTKAGRKRFDQIKRGYTAAVNSPVAKNAVRAGRKALADRLDPQPRMREVKNLRGKRGGTAGENQGPAPQIFEPDED